MNDFGIGAAEGYLAHLPWRRDYFPVLNPHLTRFAMLLGGVQPPRISSACELAFGQGISLAIHAVANPDIQWTGTDLNPGHVRFARQLVDGLAGNLALYDESFGQFCDRAGSPAFDFIGMTGAWSWVPESARDDVCRIAAQSLTGNGILGFDYMALPGQYQWWGMRDLLCVLAGSNRGSRPSAPESTLEAIDAAIDIVERLPNAARSPRAAVNLLNSLRQSPAEFTEHEYLNYHWQPHSFAQIAEKLQRSGLYWCGYWDLRATIADLDFTPAQQAYLAGFEPGIQRETVADFLIDRGKREDVWARAPIRLTQAQQEEQLRTFVLVPLRAAADFEFKAAGALGVTTLDKASYAPILEALSRHEPVSVDRLCQAGAGTGSFRDTIQAVSILQHSGFVQAIDPERTCAGEALIPCRKLNARLLGLGLEAGQSAGYLASPVTGSGVAARAEQLHLLRAYVEGCRGAKAMASFAQSVLNECAGDKSGKAIEGRPDSNSQDWYARAELFERDELAVFQRLGVV